MVKINWGQLAKNEEAKMKEYFKGETVVEYRDHVEIVSFERSVPHVEVDSAGGGAIFCQYDARDAEGNHWRYFGIEYILGDGTHHEMAPSTGYIRIVTEGE